MRILIIRHGDPDYSIDSLTEKGRREVELLSERLIKLNIDDFYVSPLGRARESAKPTLEKYGKEAKVLPWLAEWRGTVGEKPFVVGKRAFHIPWDFPPQIWTTDEKFFDRSNWFDAPVIRDGNSREIDAETREGLYSLLEKYGCKRDGLFFHCEDNRDITIALFCHFALGSTLVGYLTGVSPSVMMHAFFMPPSSVTTLVSSEVEKGVVSFRCLQMGDTSHLYAADEPLSPSGLMPEVYDPSSQRNIK